MTCYMYMYDGDGVGHCAQLIAFFCFMVTVEERLCSLNDIYIYIYIYIYNVIYNVMYMYMTLYDC